MANTSTQKQVIELTKEGLEELKLELAELQNSKLPQVIERVAAAREHGDLSENAEYHSARDEQQLIEARIEEIESILANAKVVQNVRSHGKVGMGSTVIVTKKGSKTSQAVTVVGEYEADPATSKVSVSSPLGKALSGKKKGDTVKVSAPAGEMEYTILDIK